MRNFEIVLLTKRNKNSRYLKMSQNNTSQQKCHHHLQSNPTLLATVDLISEEARFPIPCPNTNYDCCMTNQKKDLGHPLYHKWYKKTIPTFKYPIHYTIPPVDYNVYYSRMQNRANNNGNTGCYTTVKEVQREQMRQELERGCRIVPKVCDDCKRINIFKKLPHCPKCTCLWKELRREEDECERRRRFRRMYERVDYSCRDDDAGDCCNNRRRIGITNNRRSWYCQPEQENKLKIPYVPRVRNNCSGDDYSPPSGPITEYRAEYLPPKCCGPRCYEEPEFKGEKRCPKQKKDWDFSTRTQKQCCIRKEADTLAATEVKLRELDDILEKSGHRCHDIFGQIKNPYHPKPVRYDPMCDPNGKPPEWRRGPISEYRGSYKPPRCKGPRYYMEGDHVIEHLKLKAGKPEWNYSTKSRNCVPVNDSLAASECKIKTIDWMLEKCDHCDLKYEKRGDFKRRVRNYFEEVKKRTSEEKDEFLKKEKKKKSFEETE